MDVFIDHYAVLGLPSGEEGAMLSDEEIKKAYEAKVLELQPDKRLDDPVTHVAFVKLRRSYDVLKYDKDRKLFDDTVRVMKPKLSKRLAKRLSDPGTGTTEFDATHNVVVTYLQH